jgi:GT2 family glycosyltransferase
MKRAFAARHTSGAETIDQWKEMIRRAVNGHVRPTLPQPRISVITPAWNTRVAWFAEAAISLLEQSCSDWEWCIVDDASTETDFHALFPVLEATGRVKLRVLDGNEGISGATNEGLRIASGEYVCFMDHDDLLAPNALAKCLEALDRGLDAVYTDHDKVDDLGICKDAFYKPDWSPEYFRGAMYICHLLCVRREIALEIGGFDRHFDGVQDFEFMLRYSERTQRIGHLCEVLYHWRTAPGSVAASQDAKGDLGELQKEAVLAHLERLHLPAVVELGPATHCVQLVPLPLDRQPRVSIIIPTKDAPDLLEKCLGSVSKKGTYSNFETICVDNGTTDSRALSLMKTYAARRVLFPGNFNFSRAVNLGVQHAEGEFLILVHNDIEVITDDWIEAMLYYARQNEVGAVGGLLQYPDGTLQHAGVALGGRGTAAHVLQKAPADSTGYWGVLCCAREVSAVTAACMMLRREVFEKTGGFDEHYSAVYQDVDFCLQLRSLGLRNIYTPRARLFHLESSSHEPSHKLHDASLLLERWGKTIVSSDPYYNRNLNLDRCDYTITAG